MKVLVLDADPPAATAVRESFEGNVDFEMVPVITVEDATTILQQEPFDLTLITISQNEGDVLEIIGRLTGSFPSLCMGFLMEGPTPQAAQMAAQYSVLSLIEKPLTPEKLTHALQWAHQLATNQMSVGEAKESTGEGKALSGCRFLDAIRSCCLDQKTARLLVQSDDNEGSIYLHEGKVVHAEMPGLEGEEAVYEMIKWDAAQPTMEENLASPKVTISADLEQLLSEGVRRRNERDEGVSHDLRKEAAAENLVGKTVGPFQVHRKIAADSWGVLYEALQIAVNRPVALKVLNPAFYEHEEHVHQFIAFAGAMARAQNPYITVVYEAGRGNGLIFYAREYLGGADLTERVKQGRALPEDLALQTIINVGEALNYEKKNAILHTPLLMDQVLVPDKGAPKLLNNITMAGAEISPGEADEIRRLGGIVKQGMRGATGASPEFKVLLEKMSKAGQGGTGDWGTLLREASQLDLKRHAMKVVRPIGVKKIETSKTISKAGLLLKWMTTVVGVAGLACFLWWYFVLRFQKEGAGDVGTMVQVSAGPFIYQKNEKPTLPAFHIDKYEVTIGQYRKFLEVWRQNKSAIREHPLQRPGKDHTPDEWNNILTAIRSGSKFRGASIFDNTPVFNVDYFDAWAYAQWSNKRLPTEQEWEKAGRGPNGNLFPWGNTFDATKTNSGADQGYSPSDTNFGRMDGFGIWAPVGAKRDDRSAYDVMDMGGNVSEWTDSWDTNPDFPTEKVPVVRGGSWAATDVQLTTRLLRQSKLKRSRFIGFRCVADAPPSRK